MFKPWSCQEVASGEINPCRTKKTKNNIGKSHNAEFVTNCGWNEFMSQAGLSNPSWTQLQVFLCFSFLVWPEIKIIFFGKTKAGAILGSGSNLSFLILLSGSWGLLLSGNERWMCVVVMRSDSLWSLSLQQLKFPSVMTCCNNYIRQGREELF